MITREDLKRYIQDRHAFRREQVILPNGSLYGEAEEGWQLEHVWEGTLPSTTSLTWS